MTYKSPYEAANHERPEEHAIDRAIEQRLPLRKLRRQIRAATADMMAVLGERKSLWFRLEELFGAYRMRREECYFNFGYEHGAAAGRAEGLWTLAADGAPERGAVAMASRDVRAFANTIRDLSVQVELPPRLVVAALLETAWALALGLSDDRSTRDPERT